MNHQPDVLVASVFNTAKMVTGAQSAQLIPGGLELLPDDFAIRRGSKSVPLLGLLVVLKADGDLFFRFFNYTFDLFRRYFPGIGLKSHNTAADVHADSIGNDDPLRGQDAADGHAVSFMHIRHQGDMAEGKRQIR